MSFVRQIDFVIDTKRFTGLHIDFDIVHSSSQEPNPAKISIYNLASTTRGLATQKDTLIQLQAGYEDEGVGLLYRGDIRRASSIKQGTDWVTTLECGDGEVGIRTGKIKSVFPKGKKIEDIAEALGGKTGLDIGNIKKIFREKGLKDGFTQLARSFSVDGNAHDELAKLAKGAGLGLSVQDGRYVAFDPTETSNATAFVISPSTGMVESPDVGEDKTIKVKSLLLPELRPGRRVKLESEAFNSFYRVVRAQHTGSFRGNDWYTTLDLVEYL